MFLILIIVFFAGILIAIYDEHKKDEKEKKLKEEMIELQNKINVIDALTNPFQNSSNNHHGPSANLLMNWESYLENGISNVNSNQIDNYEEFFYDNTDFYKSSYLCPYCKKQLLHKVKARGVKTSFRNYNLNVFNVFTCSRCRKFYASIDDDKVNYFVENNVNNTDNRHFLFAPLTKLSQFALVSKSYDENKYKSMLIYVQQICSASDSQYW